MQAAISETAINQTQGAPATGGTRPSRLESASTGSAEQRLSGGESVLLLGAFFTLAVSLASFATL